jgi:hypothetical protein
VDILDTTAALAWVEQRLVGGSFSTAYSACIGIVFVRRSDAGIVVVEGGDIVVGIDGCVVRTRGRQSP